MAKRNDPSQKMKDEAQEYLDALPDETAEGRLVTDDGTPADAADWDSEEARQQARINKKGNQSR
jgi:hypothetical protein